MMFLKVHEGSCETRFRRIEKTRPIMSLTVMEPNAGNDGSWTGAVRLTALLYVRVPDLDGGAREALEICVACGGLLAGTFCVAVCSFDGAGFILFFLFFCTTCFWRGDAFDVCCTKGDAFDVSCTKGGKDAKEGGSSVRGGLCRGPRMKVLVFLRAVRRTLQFT